MIAFLGGELLKRKSGSISSKIVTKLKANLNSFFVITEQFTKKKKKIPSMVFH